MPRSAMRRLRRDGELPPEKQCDIRAWGSCSGHVVAREWSASSSKWKLSSDSSQRISSCIASVAASLKVWTTFPFHLASPTSNPTSITPSAFMQFWSISTAFACSWLLLIVFDWVEGLLFLLWDCSYERTSCQTNVGIGEAVNSLELTW